MLKPKEAYSKAAKKDIESRKDKVDKAYRAGLISEQEYEDAIEIIRKVCNS
jgi:uncharacterized protein YqgQ